MLTTKETAELKRLDRKWAVQKASKKEMLRVMDLRRKRDKK